MSRRAVVPSKSSSAEPSAPNTISASTINKASPVGVWGILTDLPSYGAWCPFTEAMVGTLAQGATVVSSVRLRPGDKGTRRTVLRVAALAPREVTWEATLGGACLLHSRVGTSGSSPAGRPQSRKQA